MLKIERLAKSQIILVLRAIKPKDLNRTRPPMSEGGEPITLFMNCEFQY
jgi:hypothetical protein